MRNLSPPCNPPWRNQECVPVAIKINVHTPLLLGCHARIKINTMKRFEINTNSCSRFILWLLSHFLIGDKELVTSCDPSQPNPLRVTDAIWRNKIVSSWKGGAYAQWCLLQRPRIGRRSLVLGRFCEAGNLDNWWYLIRSQCTGENAHIC